MIGYKGTDKNMKCLGFQYELGKWYEHDGELDLCAKGFHFCYYLSGVFSYYDMIDSRVFKVEAEEILDLPIEPGADRKLVCKRIRLVEELTATGDRNTGDRNTGNNNTGNRNTGNNNTGNRNTGNNNTGDRNTGNRNTGYGNTGYGNTGNSNTGDSNTGYGNTGKYHSGFFCSDDEIVRCFDGDSRLYRKEFDDRFGEMARRLGTLLLDTTPIKFDDFKLLPNITPEKLKRLHDAHIAGRQIAL